MFKYHKRVFEGILDKCPKYSFPETLQHALDDLHDLRPSLCEIQIHHHGNESAVVVEGSNLWFCYQVLFRGQKMLIPAKNMSGSSICFNVDMVSCNPQSVVKEDISVDSYFKSKPIRQKVDVVEKVSQSAHILIVYYIIILNPFTSL